MRSYAASNRAHIRLKKAQVATAAGQGDTAMALLNEGEVFARRALDLFAPNDSAEKIYLSRLFDKAKLGDAGAAAAYLDAYAVAVDNDYSLVPLYGPKTAQLYRAGGNEAAAQAVEKTIALYESRMQRNA